MSGGGRSGSRRTRASWPETGTREDEATRRTRHPRVDRLARVAFDAAVRLTPRSFRARHALEMRAMFRRRWREARRDAGLGILLSLLIREILDLLVAAVRLRLDPPSHSRSATPVDGSLALVADPGGDGRRTLKLAWIGALAFHLLLFSIVLPDDGNGSEIHEIEAESPVVLRTLPPPPPVEERTRPPAEKKSVRPVPIPAVEPDAPEPPMPEVETIQPEPGAFHREGEFVTDPPAKPPAAERPPDRPLRSGVDVERPRLLHRVKPVYPRVAAVARIEGRVIVEAMVDEEGTVVDARIVEGRGFGLDRAAIDAVSRWRFAPTLYDGRPVRVVLKVVVDFEIR